MASSNVLGQILDVLLSRPTGYRRRRPSDMVDTASGGLDRIGDRFRGGLRPNAPRMITVLVAVALTIVGLSVTVLPIDAVNDFIRDQAWTVTEEQAWWMLGASPVLLIAGSLFRGL